MTILEMLLRYFNRKYSKLTKLSHFMSLTLIIALKYALIFE